jgi:hypothetical protein
VHVDDALPLAGGGGEGLRLGVIGGELAVVGPCGLGVVHLALALAEIRHVEHELRPGDLVRAGGAEAVLPGAFGLGHVALQELRLAQIEMAHRVLGVLGDRFLDGGDGAGEVASHHQLHPAAELLPEGADARHALGIAPDAALGLGRLLRRLFLGGGVLLLLGSLVLSGGGAGDGEGEEDGEGGQKRGPHGGKK